jgi:pectinesterase
MKQLAKILIVISITVPQIRASFSQGTRMTVKATNALETARPNETVVLETREITKALPVSDWKRVHVVDAAASQELLCQAVDMNGDDTYDLFLFQSDFKGGESKAFFLQVGNPNIATREQYKAYGRFVRERYDDFAWENDRVAHRMYGTALETWQKEPLTSSAVDVWCKRVRRLVINDWYMVDNYHADTGEGADFYSAGKSRGCGGSGIWEAGKLFVSRNFISSKVIASGPIRVVFELTYAPWEVNGRKISEIKRVTLDAGQNLNRFESYYKGDFQGDLRYATGIKKNEGSTVISNEKAGWLRTWEPVRKGQEGNLGCGIIVDPAQIEQVTQAEGNYLIIARAPAGKAVYYAGFGWDRSGDFLNVNDWEKYLDQYTQRLRSPLKISISRD